MTRAGLALLAVLAAVALLAPALVLHEPARQYRDHVLAPPMPPRVIDDAGRLRAPFFYPIRLADRLARRYEEDRSRPVPLGRRWLARGSAHRELAEEPWFPLGTDSLGRDLWSRMVVGTRVSLALAALAVVGALSLGLVLGGVAGYFGGLLDAILMRTCELVMVLPALYVVVALRAVLPLSLSPGLLLVSMAALLAVVGTPQVARAVRNVAAVERQRDYVVAARAMGRRELAVLLRHVLPATRETVLAQGLLLVPAFILAESTLSFLGLGFDATVPSWGTVLQEAANVRAIAEYPWVLAPAAAIAATVLAINLVIEGRDLPSFA